MAPDSAPTAPEPAQAKKRKLWAALLVLDVVFVFVFSGAVAGLLYIRSTTPPLDQPAQRDKGRKGRTPAAAQAPVAAKPEEKKPEAKPEPKAEPKPDAKAEPKPAEQPAAAPSPAPGGKVRARSVEFTVAAAGAKEVFLKGAFLVRTAGKKPMVKDSQGTWRLSISLLPGSYKYSFIVDGKRAPGGDRVVE